MGQKLTTPQKWAAEYYTTKIIPCKKAELYDSSLIQHVDPLCEYEQTYIDIDQSNSYIITGITRSQNYQSWLQEHQNEMVYDSQTNELVCTDALQPNHYYYTDSDFIVPVDYRNGPVKKLALQKNYLTLCCATGEKQPDIKTHCSYNQFQQNVSLDYNHNSTQMGLWWHEDEFPNEKHERIKFQAEPVWQQYKMGNGQQKSSSHAFQKQNDGYILISTIENKKDTTRDVVMLHASKTHATIVCKLIDSKYHRLFISPNGTIAGWYDAGKEEFVVFKVFDEHQIPGILAEKLAKVHDIVWRFATL